MEEDLKRRKNKTSEDDVSMVLVEQIRCCEMIYGKERRSKGRKES